MMDRGGESCKGVGVAVVIKPNISLEIVTANLLLPSQYCGS